MINKNRKSVYWNSKQLRTVVKLSLCSTPALDYWSVQYCLGKIKSGESVWVQLPFSTLEKKNIKRQLLEFGRDENVFVSNLNMFKAISTSIVHVNGR